MTPSRVHGFTLMEAMAAIAIAGIIIGGATGAVMNLNRLVMDTGNRTEVWDEAKRLEEFLVARTQAAGGGILRPHMALFVEDARTPATALAPALGCRTVTGMPACTPVTASNGSDRLTVLTQNGTYPQCPVTAVTATKLTVGASGSSACCLDDGPAPASSSWNAKQALLVGNNATVAVSLFASNRAGCELNVVAGQAQNLIGSPGTNPTVLTVSAITPASLVIVDAETFYVENNALKQWKDLNGNMILESGSGEVTTVHDRVYDLQLAVGYDFNPQDGRVVDTNSGSDEWIYNTSADAATTALASQLCMVQIGVSVGTASSVMGGNQVTLLNRPVAAQVGGVYLSATSSKSFMRNLAIFTQ